MDKPILALDFDGVLHSYVSGWQGCDVIGDPPVPGAVEFVRAAQEHFEVVVCSSRARDCGAATAMARWLDKWGFPTMTITNRKPAAFVSIDDRALQFVGLWPDLDILRAFLPGSKRSPLELGALPTMPAPCERWNAVMAALSDLYASYHQRGEYLDELAALLIAYDAWLD